MSMSKKDFIALADTIKAHNETGNPFTKFEFTADQIRALANFCQSLNPAFNWERWMGYVAGENGKNGGAIRPVKPSEWLG